MSKNSIIGNVYKPLPDSAWNFISYIVVLDDKTCYIVYKSGVHRGDFGPYNIARWLGNLAQFRKIS